MTALQIQPGQTIEIRGVLAGAYRGKDVGDRSLLTHAVLVGANGRDVRTLCKKVPIDHMCDQVEAGPVSCLVCFGRLARLLLRFPGTPVIQEPPKDLNAP